MYQSFSIVTMESVMANKQIIVHANADINVNSIKDAIIEVYQRGSKENVTFTVEVKNKLLIITFRDWPTPNAEYIVSISKLKSVTDEDLDSSVKKKIVFKSDIVSTVELMISLEPFAIGVISAIRVFKINLVIILLLISS